MNRRITELTNMYEFVNLRLSGPRENGTILFSASAPFGRL